MACQCKICEKIPDNKHVPTVSAVPEHDWITCVCELCTKSREMAGSEVVRLLTLAREPETNK